MALHVFLETAGPFHSLDKAVIVHATRSLTRNSHSASEAVSRRFQHNLQGQGKGLSINTGNTSQAHNTHSSSWIATEENLGGAPKNRALFICCPTLSMSQLQSSWGWFLATSNGTGGCWKGRSPNLFCLPVHILVRSRLSLLYTRESLSLADRGVGTSVRKGVVF